MGKASRRKRQAVSDIHAQIALEAHQARCAPFGLATSKYPALCDLLRAARSEVERSTPRQITYEGRTYWCRVSHGMSLIELFDSPACGTPMARTICGNSEIHGHTPAH